MEQLIRLALEQIHWQSNANSSLDTKGIGLLAFDGVFATALAAVGHDVVLKMLSAVFLLLSIILSVDSLRISAIDLGPKARDLYESVSREDSEKIQAQIVASLSESAETNERILARKDILILAAAVALIISAVLFAATIAAQIPW